MVDFRGDDNYAAPCSLKITLCHILKWKLVKYILNKLGLSCAKLRLASAKLHTSLSSDQLKLATN